MANGISRGGIMVAATIMMAALFLAGCGKPLTKRAEPICESMPSEAMVEIDLEPGEDVCALTGGAFMGAAEQRFDRNRNLLERLGRPVPNQTYRQRYRLPPRVLPKNTGGSTGAPPAPGPQGSPVLATISSDCMGACTGPAKSETVNILVMSGGGPYGAYGAGFLEGWSDNDGSDPDFMDRDELDFVTGISTGAVALTMAFLGNDWPHPSPPTPHSQHPDDRARDEFTSVNSDDLYDEQGTLKLLKSNAVADPEGLEEKLSTLVDDYIDSVKHAHYDDKVPLVGSVNLDDSKFFITNLRTIAQDTGITDEQRKICYREAVLASASVPVQFPPRFVKDTDSETYMLVDGGVRFGAFLHRLHQAIIDVNCPSKLRIFVIVNGTLSPNIAECDEGGICDPQKNKLIDIAKRTLFIFSDQINRDSVYRIEKEARRVEAEFSGLTVETRYTYISNQDIWDRAARFPTCPGFVAQPPDDSVFNQDFMSFLYCAGMKRGQNWEWKTFDEMPH